jgi:hypothetical protein
MFTFNIMQPDEQLFKPFFRTPLVVSIVHILLSIFPTYLLLLAVYHELADSIMAGQVNPGSWPLYEMHGLLLLGPIPLLSACFLQYNKRIGWIGSVFSSCGYFLGGFAFTVSIIRWDGPAGIPWILFAVLILLFFLTCIVFMNRPKILIKYKVTRKTLWLTLALVLLLLADILWLFQ